MNKLQVLDTWYPYTLPTIVFQSPKQQDILKHLTCLTENKILFSFKAPVYFKWSSFRSSFGGKKKFVKAERRYTVFKHSNSPTLLEAGCRLM